MLGVIRLQDLFFYDILSLGGFMRNYLVKFFNDFDYEQEDAQYLLDTYDKIMADEQTANIWTQAIAIHDNDINCDYSKILELADDVSEKLYLHEYTLELLIFICLSKKLETIYSEHNIDSSIFHNSMLDLRYKLEECKVVKGVIGSFVGFWFPGFFNLTRFSLGRLQFEITKFGHNYEKNGHVLSPESNVINVHIPRTLTPLDEKSCDESFAMAKVFFEALTGDTCAFVCHSWLLYPENKKIISEKSNIYRFMMRFDIVSYSVDESRKDLWRFFDTEEKNPDRLPTNTTLRKAYVEHLKKGGKVGVGYGVFFM